MFLTDYGHISPSGTNAIILSHDYHKQGQKKHSFFYEVHLENDINDLENNLKSLQFRIKFAIPTTLFQRQKQEG